MMCFRFCCDCDRDQDPEAEREPTLNNSLAESSSSASNRMERPYQVANDDEATAELVLDHDDNSQQDCCRNEGDAQRGLRQFFKALRAKFRRYDSLESPTEFETFHKPNKRLSLRPALSFDSSTKGVLTISSEEVVLPGSDIQRQMSKLMAESIESQDDECVICMEAFDPTNPRMPTFCGCGANKTYFHLPCLYQWIEQSQDCPSCRQKLRWEEF